MRRWIEHLLTNASAYSDFIDWAKGAEDTLNGKIAKAIRGGSVENATGMAHEIKVYEEIRKKVEAEVRERTSQANHEQGGS